MSGKISLRKCLILAAGRGSRLAGWGTAKPRLRLLGVPLIERVILTAQRAGLSEFTIVTGYEGPGLQKFLDDLAVRRGLCLDTVANEEWKTAGNGWSVLKAKDILREPFVLLMADHLVDERLLMGLQSEPLAEGTVRLAVDRDLDNPLVDRDDATKVRTEDGVLREIGQGIGRYDAFDTGCFLCSPALFPALERAATDRGDTTLSGGIQILAREGKVLTHDIGDNFWIDVDDARAVKRAEKLFLDRLPKTTDGPVARHLNRPLSKRLSRHLVRSSITPNQISLFCFGVSALAAGLFAMGGHLLLALGAVFAQFASVIDGCDGEVARLKFRESSFGGWFDAVLDRYADAILLFGLTWHAFVARDASIVLIVGFLAIVGSFMNSYTADKYDHLMQARFEQGKGIRIGRDVRVLMISLGALLNQPFLTLSLIAGLMNVETVRRVVVARGDA
ncbi:MAG: NTP transferase domain-containing protein [Myxococcota bacterium]